MARSVDSAMAAERADKSTIRETWIDDVVSAYNRGVEGRLYLTLCGAAAYEIQMLVEAGVIELEENSAIHRDSVDRVIAVEENPEAVLELQQRYPGLRIYEESIENVMRLPSSTRWPDGELGRDCRARVINLDYNGSLAAMVESGALRIDDFEVVVKLAAVHADYGIDWRLFLTYNATTSWDDEVFRGVAAFLAENFALEPEFEAMCIDYLGEEVVDSCRAGEFSNLRRLDDEGMQRLLQAFVPKRLASLTYSAGWLVRIVRNLRYGAAQDRAPMVTFAIDFERTGQATTEPISVYRKALRTIFDNIGHVTEDGEIVTS